MSAVQPTIEMTANQLLLLLLPQVSTRDHLIPPAMQFELADKLHAKTVTFPAGKASNLL
jgi:hypothetical protein